MLNKKLPKRHSTESKVKSLTKSRIGHVFKKKPKKEKGSISELGQTKKTDRIPRLKKFLDYEQIRFLLNTMLQSYPENLEMEIIGYSKEERPIFLMLLARNVEEPRKNALFIEAGSNGEDVMAVATALYIINYLCAHASSSTTLLFMDVYVLPCANPDDYELALCGRKTHMNLAKSFPFRLAHYNADEIGVENYLEVNHKWKENLRIQNFEKLALIKGIADYQTNIRLFVSLQEEGEKIVYPFGTKIDLYDTNALSYVAKIGKLGSEIDFRIGSVFQQCGLTCGTIIDFLRLFSQYLKFTYIIHMNDKKKGQLFRRVPYLAENVLCVITLMAKEVNNYYKTQAFYPECAKMKTTW